jgi:transcriptional regulator with XRE-family HTH domain
VVPCGYQLKDMAVDDDRVPLASIHAGQQTCMLWPFSKNQMPLKTNPQSEQWHRPPAPDARRMILTSFCKQCMLTAGMHKTLGNRIRELREKLDLSLRDFAKRVGNTPAHISDIELGRRNPSDDLLQKMSTVLDEPVEDLRKYDTRAPVEELKRRIESDPAYGFALRTLTEKEISADDILKWANKKPYRSKGK